MIAESKDSKALIAQLTVVFHLLLLFLGQSQVISHASSGDIGSHSIICLCRCDRLIVRIDLDRLALPFDAIIWLRSIYSALPIFSSSCP
jgi:hypothetical protein